MIMKVMSKCLPLNESHKNDDVKIVVIDDNCDIKIAKCNHIVPFFLLNPIAELLVCTSLSKDVLTSIEDVVDSEHCVFLTEDSADVYKEIQSERGHIMSYDAFKILVSELIPIPYLVNCKTLKPLLIRNSDKIALVGNSSCIIDSGYGKDIDDYNIVFRFNLGNIHRSYDSDLGIKTSLRALNGKISNVLVKEYDNICKTGRSKRYTEDQIAYLLSSRLVVADKRMSIDIADKYGITVYTKKFNHRKIMNFLSDHKLLYSGAKHNAEIKSGITPTSGLIYALTLLNFICHIDVYGIDINEPSNEYRSITEGGVKKSRTVVEHDITVKKECIGYDHKVFSLLQHLGKCNIHSP